MRTPKIDHPTAQIRTPSTSSSPIKQADTAAQAPGRIDVDQVAQLPSPASQQVIGHPAAQHGGTGPIGGVGRPHAKKVKVGAYTELAGQVANRSGMRGIGGETAPEGSYLVLDKPIKVGTKTVKEVFLFGRELENGAHVSVHGRVDEASWGGVERPRTDYIQLSGITMPSKGEPRYDGQDFFNANGEKLAFLSDTAPQMYDAPARLFILDPSKEKAFLGSIGGHIPRNMNPFHGIRGETKIMLPTDADRAAVKFDAQEVARNAAGVELTLVGEFVDPATQSDQMTRRFYLDRDAGKIYGFESGGVGGFHNRMTSVIPTEIA